MHCLSPKCLYEGGSFYKKNVAGQKGLVISSIIFGFESFWQTLQAIFLMNVGKQQARVNLWEIFVSKLLTFL